MLKGKKILLGVTGSIAAFKTAALVRLLVKEGAEVRIILTAAARDFVTPLTLSTLSHYPVLSDITDQDVWNNHVELGRWADVMLIAPLSCNSLSKMANGYCDNLLMASYLSATCPVVVAPAMDEDMWKHPSTRKNISLLESYGNNVIPVGKGELASGLIGEGRMAEPEQILAWLNDFFLTAKQFEGKRVLVTAGPTHEAIDPVRFIGNHSSGKMGIALAEAFAARGAMVELVLGPVSLSPRGNITVTNVVDAASMYEAVSAKAPQSDIVVMAAAVADYTVRKPLDSKMKKKEEGLQLELVPTVDILKKLGASKPKGQVLVGFALETDNEIPNALHKLQSKNLDLIVLNSMKDPDAGFGSDNNTVTIFDKDGGQSSHGPDSKKNIAFRILDTIINKYYA
jgi:phosphopantothenoylcysteine decarboxylase/phosphopantothenate--cysteine ligase